MADLGQKYSQLILDGPTTVRVQCPEEIKSLIRNFKCQTDQIIPYESNVKEWLRPVIDLSEFHEYPMNGITEGLNWWMSQEPRGIQTIEGDYEWVKPKEGSSPILYLSLPSAIDGNINPLPNYDGPIALDLAYVGTTEKFFIPVDERVEFVFYSLSKSFGLPNLRTGWLFTKSPQPLLDDLIYWASYYNTNAQSIANLVFQHFPIDFTVSKFRDRQIEICKNYCFQPSDSVWLATTQNESYDKFKRNKVNRLCLAPYYS